jgi:predicted nucleic acid-binding protein
VNVLVDTNVLLRLADENHAMHAAATHAVEVFRRTKMLCIFPQKM